MQFGSLVSYCRKLTKADGFLDFSQPASLLACRIRAFKAWPGSFFEHRGNRIKIGLAHASSESELRPGEIKKTTETGDGPVDAIFKCVKKLYPHDVKLQLYQVHAVTEGTDAQATVSVRIEENGKTTVGQASDTDTLVASANAYLSALNKMIIKRKKTAPIEHETQKVKGI